MTFTRSSLLTLVLVTPGIINAASLRFDYEAPLGDTGYGVQPGSYFVVDTTVDASGGVFVGGITEGVVYAEDPLSGSGTYGGSDPIDLHASYDGSDTTWTVPVSDGTNSATMSLTFSDIDLATSLVDDETTYLAQFSEGAVSTFSFGSEISLDIQNLNVTNTSPVPLPPTFFLMASSLLMLFWRGKYSFSNAKVKLVGVAD